jgi:hypothetical protein
MRLSLKEEKMDRIRFKTRERQINKIMRNKSKKKINKKTKKREKRVRRRVRRRR